MQSTQQLPTLSAEEAPRKRPLARRRSDPGTQGQEKAIVTIMNFQETSSSPSSPSPSQKRIRKAGPPGVGPHFRPLPTIETIMTYGSIPQPVYNSLVRGDPPATDYDTVIHTPKPASLRAIDYNMLRAAEMQAFWRHRRRARSNTVSSYESTISRWSSSTGSDDTDSTIPSSTPSVRDEDSEPASPVSVSSTSKATVASSPPRTPYGIPFLVATSPTPSLSIESDILDSYVDPSSLSTSHETSPVDSFHSSVTSPSGSTVDLGASTNSSHSSAPSPSSSVYPSPPPTPQISRHSSSSGDEFMYPSPPSSPLVRTKSQHRQSRAFTLPIDARRLRASTASGSLYPLTNPASQDRRRSLDLSQDAALQEYDIGEQRLGNGPLFTDEEEQLEWSMNGGRIVPADEEDDNNMEDVDEEETVIYGAAGVALSPRLMKGVCCHCEHMHRGLGLYVIDEIGEEEQEREVRGDEE